MHFMLGLAMFLAILWVLTATRWGRVVLFCSFVLMVLSVVTVIAVRDHQQAQKVVQAEREHINLCANAPKAADYLRMEPTIQGVIRDIYSDCP